MPPGLGAPPRRLGVLRRRSSSAARSRNPILVGDQLPHRRAARSRPADLPGRLQFMEQSQGAAVACAGPLRDRVGASTPPSGGFKTLPGWLEISFRCDRGQLLLMPPSLVEWLPEDHLVWTVLGAVDQMDLDRFAEAYRLGAAGRAPYDPADDGGVVALRVCARDSVLAGDRAGVLGGCGVQGDHGDAHARITPRSRSSAAGTRREIAELFDEVLGLCREAGLVSVGVITIDGTKIKANASMDQNRSYSGAGQRDPARGRGDRPPEDELYGDDRGDELPEQLRTRRAAARRWRTRSVGWRSAKASADRGAEPEPESWRWIWRLRCWVVRCCGAAAGVEWPRVARRELEAHRARQAARRSRVIAMTGCSKRSSGSRRTTGSTWPRTRPMSAGARRRGTRRVGC